MIFCNKRQTKTIVKMFRDKVLSRFDVIKCNGKIVVEGIAFGAHEGWERTAANSEHPPFGVSQRVANKGLNGEGGHDKSIMRASGWSAIRSPFPQAERVGSLAW